MTRVPLYKSPGSSSMAAFTARPDLWPPGSDVWVAGVCVAAWGHLDWVYQALQAAQAYEAPGVVEAHVLRDQRPVVGMSSQYMVKVAWEGPT